MDLKIALNAYLAARAEAGYEVDNVDVTEAAGTYYLSRADLFPLTLGTETEAIDALLAATLSLRNV